MILGDSLSSESLDREYKEFRLGLVYENGKDYREFYENKQYLNLLFQDILFESLNKYISKYTCSFHNSRIDGKLYFGVSDEGEIIGVPLINSEISDIRQRIWIRIVTLIRDTIICNSFEKIVEKIEVVFNKIDPKGYIMYCYPSTKAFIESRQVESDNYIQIKSEYSRRKKIFIDFLEKNRRSLNIILSETSTRISFIEFLRCIGVYRIFQEELVTKSNYNFSSPEIKILKKNPNSIIFWCALYRDFVTDIAIKYLRPIWDYSVRPVDPYFQLLQEFKPCVQGLMENGFGLYVIEIQFNFKGVKMMDPDLSYQNDGEIRSPFRTTSEQGEPCCMFRF